MADPFKSLQVTFGAFSCRLEGFDDPAAAMVAVEEHLGRAGEGLTLAEGRSRLDGKALACIAKRGGAARVVVDVDGTGLVLRATKTPGAAPTGRRRLPAPPPDDDAVLDRILSQADSHLADPESARRRDAIASLKAAVAATEAERVLGEANAGGVVRHGVFRNDLRDAVGSRPRGGPSTPPPLRLKASQRVDHGPEPLEEGTGSELQPFADFADRVGARSLPDLLEAAAAWAAGTGGREACDPPTLMTLAASRLSGTLSPEDGLGCISALLREGKLAREGNGSYRPGPRSRFHPGKQAR
ncbi:hypothetical protein FHG66_04255 [Rubellimicrobium rubrum]|uniref:Uncharacterized protein n=1 Tax=Rubellimicrobium rubrum TaxID=2585369 RepID=A0A5C4N5U9_9RHOB|nr:hypothetical protein [Rubellimicrobium rubrum]TNC52019.1 hypothetical protein FHG66_04255 [Rubellimicrobium rubrum]